MDNKAVAGKMKDEMCSQAASCFVGLRPKMYSLVCGTTETKRAKGIKKQTIEKHLRHKHYEEALLEQAEKVSEMDLIRSSNHVMYCQHIHKKSLSCFDDKRWLLEDNITSYPYGYKVLAVPT